ncbi:hypothetical protein CRG98_007734 [Punica granatum]|uniref:Uncharacterized protein n=1 Tax=Punica granatum TaxID=22663 RepID=A0A2I0KTS0_PUNGR|nr:hypothetical protein CRG98_007734 [Punica granatum]
MAQCSVTRVKREAVDSSGMRTVLGGLDLKHPHIPRYSCWQVFREGNFCADALAWKSVDLREHFVVLLQPLPDMYFMLFADATSVGRARLVTSVNLDT